MLRRLLIVAWLSLLPGVAAGGPDAAHDAGVEAYDRGDFQQAIEHFEHAFALGNDDAAFRLALMHEHGEGVMPSTRRAIEWYRKAAEAGNEKAQFNLGQMYAGGRGVEIDTEEAARWYRMSAEQENPHAQFIIGLMYYHGDAGRVDLVEAYRWVTRAVHGYDANHFRDNANSARREIMRDMSDEQLEAGEALVREDMGW